jgi:serine/threonine protein phosphatase 1
MLFVEALCQDNFPGRDRQIVLPLTLPEAEMVFGLRNFFGAKPNAQIPARPKIILPKWPAAVYAIGDVHGCIRQLEALHERIYEDGAGILGDKLIVGLGDYVDRGSDAAAVLEYLQGALPEGFSRVCLAGNHEVMMLDHIAAPSSADRWLTFGGVETLISYGINAVSYLAASQSGKHEMLRNHIPMRHIRFMEALPIVLSLPGATLVHAAIQSGLPLDEQDEQWLLWGRYLPDHVIPSDQGLIVHGHTPTAEALVLGNRICVDTGAFATGMLTAVRLSSDLLPSFIKVQTNAP